MSRRRNLVFGGSLIAAIALLGMVRAGLDNVAASPVQMVQAPMFEVDPFWPKPLPNGWVYGTVIGVTVDAQDNVYIVHRGVVGTATSGGWTSGEGALAVFAENNHIYAQRLINYGSSGGYTNLGGSCGNSGFPSFSHSPGIGTDGK